MAGVKGRSGGARFGAGRKAGPQKATPTLDLPAEHDPLTFLLAVMNTASADPRLRVMAAVAAAPYCHQKQADAGKKGAAEKAAGTAAAGRFAPAAPPRLVVDNT